MRRSLFGVIFFAVFAALVAGGAGLFIALARGFSNLPALAAISLLAALVLATAAALWLTYILRRALAALERMALSFPERQPAISPADRFRAIDRIAVALSAASESASEALRRAADSRHELEALLDSMQDAVIAVDAAGRIQWTNREMQSLIPGNSIAGSVRIGHALVQTIRDPDVLACVRTALDEGTICQRRTTTLLPGRIFEVNASPMLGGGAVALLHDITRIEHVERMQRDFVANVSHELRTPLTSISGYVETLLDHEPLGPAAREFMTIILKNAARMQRLTEDLLTMTRVESDEAELHLEPVAADHLVREAVEGMRGLVQETGATVEIGEVAPIEIFADADSVMQVLGNLIENGIKYGQTRSTGRSRIIVGVRLTAPEEDRPATAEFSVRDFGQGIASEHLPRIFERFYRVDKARSRESGGTGLGLAIARHVVEMQGGSIRAESTLGQGSEFLVRLPLASPAPEPPASPSFHNDVTRP